MGLYVIETDAPCKQCNDTHLYVTQMCTLSVFTDYGTAYYISSNIEGSAIREIEEVPEGISYTLYLHKNGRPDAAYPRTVTDVSSG